jgi:hypothetical protein
VSRAEVVTVTCDRRHDEPEPGTQHLVTLDGQVTQVDLCDYHAQVLTDFLAAGRPQARQPAPRRAGKRRTEAGRRRGAAVRAWAVGEGLLAAGSRGRIADAVLAKYDDAANGGAR